MHTWADIHLHIHSIFMGRCNRLKFFLLKDLAFSEKLMKVTESEFEKQEIPLLSVTPATVKSNDVSFVF